jgi:peptidoglycan/xylan/chitin deacetylase (PgdA/CDA1 family)
MYHSISEPGAGPLRHLAVAPAVFERQLEALSSLGYEFLGVEAALRAARTTPGRRIVALTFDDAYEDFLTNALPVLQSLGAGATLYVPTSYLGQQADWLGPNAGRFGRLLTLEEVAEVARAGIEVGSHGHVHQPLDLVPTGELKAQLITSRAVLAAALGGPPRSLCYPHGYSSRRVRDVARAVGFRSGVAIGHRLHDVDRSPYAVQRMDIGWTTHRGTIDRLLTVGPPQTRPRIKRAATPAWREVRRTARTLAGRTLT